MAHIKIKYKHFFMKNNYRQFRIARYPLVRDKTQKDTGRVMCTQLQIHKNSQKPIIHYINKFNKTYKTYTLKTPRSAL